MSEFRSTNTRSARTRYATATIIGVFAFHVFQENAEAFNAPSHPLYHP